MRVMNADRLGGLVVGHHHDDVRLGRAARRQPEGHRQHEDGQPHWHVPTTHDAPFPERAEAAGLSVLPVTPDR